MKISPNSNKTFNNQIIFLKIANYLKEACFAGIGCAGH